MAAYEAKGVPQGPFLLTPCDVAWSCCYWRDAKSDPGDSFQFHKGRGIQHKNGFFGRALGILLSPYYGTDAINIIAGDLDNTSGQFRLQTSARSAMGNRRGAGILRISLSILIRPFETSILVEGCRDSLLPF